jgi:nucleoside-diphosphate-sugar epimerase
MKILITGSKGAIGSHLVPYLRNRKHEVVQVIADITDYDRLREIFVEHKDADWSINLAAQVNTITCDVAERYSVDVNVKGAFNVATISKEFGIKHCYFSTTAIYDPRVSLISEESQKNPATLYGFTKYLGEQIVQFVFKDKPEELLILRPCFVFGGDNDHSIGSQIISSAIKQVPLVVLLDPENKKDYMHVDNFCEAVALLIEEKHSGDFNISYGQPIRFKELVEKVKNLGLNPIVYYRPEKDYMKNHVVDNSKLKSMIDWNPTITLDQGLTEVFHKLMNKKDE